MLFTEIIGLFSESYKTQKYSVRKSAVIEYRYQRTLKGWTDNQMVAKTVIVRFQVFTAVSIKTTVFYDVELCSLAESGQHFRGGYCLQLQVNLLITLMTDAISISETFFSFYQTTRCKIPEDSYIQSRSFTGPTSW